APRRHLDRLHLAVTALAVAHRRAFTHRATHLTLLDSFTARCDAAVGNEPQGAGEERSAMSDGGSALLRRLKPPSPDDRAVDGRRRAICVFAVSAVRLYREGLCESLDRRDGIEVVGAAARVAEGVATIATLEGQTDVVLLDIAAPAGLEAARELV